VKRAAISGVKRPEIATCHQFQPSSLAYVLYGVSAGIVTTALGALGAAVFTGGIVVWVTVTAVLSAGAAWIAAPVIALWARSVRNERSLRHPHPL
jgi:hypothetical protein